jgi:hypothetical protein
MKKVRPSFEGKSSIFYLVLSFFVKYKTNFGIGSITQLFSIYLVVF